MGPTLRRLPGLALALVTSLSINQASADAPRPLAVSVDRCAARSIDTPAYTKLLEIELPTIWSLRSTRSAQWPGLDNPLVAQLRVTCESESTELVLLASLEVQGAKRQIRADLSAESPEMRPRTLALATAELLRSVPTEPIEVPRPPPPPSVASAVFVPSWPMNPPPTPAARVTRALSIGLGAGTLALLSAGIPLTAAGQASNPGHLANNGMTLSGTVLLSLAALSLTGTVVSFAFWLRERRRPATRSLAHAEF